MSDQIQKTPPQSPMEILNAAFARKKRRMDAPGAGDYDHPQADQILSGAKRILSFTPTGQELLTFAEEKDIKIRVIKDSKPSGYIPSSALGVLTATADQKKTYPSTVLNLIRIIREAQQEEIGYPSPSPSLPEEEYVRKDLEKQEDIYVVQFHVSYQLYKGNGIDDLIKAMKLEWDPQAIDAFINHMETN